jgi:hypothetical protein
MQLAVERPDPIAQTREPGALDDRRAAHAVVLTWIVSQPSSARRTVTFALVAFECFATLARASDTTKYAAASVEAGGRFAMSTLTLDRHRRPGRERRERGVEPSIGEARPGGCRGRGRAPR